MGCGGSYGEGPRELIEDRQTLLAIVGGLPRVVPDLGAGPAWCANRSKELLSLQRIPGGAGIQKVTVRAGSPTGRHKGCICEPLCPHNIHRIGLRKHPQGIGTPLGGEISQVR